MSKKKTVTFNLFEAEEYMGKSNRDHAQDASESEPNGVGDQFSFFQNGQTEDNPFQVTSVTPRAQEEERPDVIEEIGDDVIEPVPAEEPPVEETPAEETPVEETPVEEVPAEEIPAEETPVEDAEEEAHWDPVQTEQVDRMAANLESDVLDEDDFTYPAQESFLPQNEAQDEPGELQIDALPSFDDIRRTDVAETFETPYRYEAASGARVRYRLSLPKKTGAKKARRLYQFFSLALTVIIALILALFLRAFVFLFATVDGPSMQPTLVNGERVLVTRYTYALSPIERGDVVVCRFDHPNFPDYYVKRVIALSGETIRITDGVVYINGSPLAEDYTLSPAASDFPETLVPEGCVFVLGDNRNNSTDSRKVGPIRESRIIGKARCILYPFSQFGKGLDQ